MTTNVPAPQSVEDVETLVKRLYKPGPPSVIENINDQLQKLQLSSDGWKLADALMGSEDQNVRFFGALTFTVKLNNDGHTLDAETAQTVLMRLIYWLVRLVGRGEGTLVSKKLCSTLTTYFIQAPFLWQSPLLHLSISFAQGDAVALGDVDPQTDISSVLPVLTPPQLIALLSFATTLAEEVGRVESNTQAYAHLHNEMEQTVKHASALMSWSFRQSTAGPSPKGEALQTYLAWINYGQPVWPRKPEPLQSLRDLINQAAECLLDQELFSEALDIFRDVLETYTSFFKPEHMELLAGIIYNHVRPKLLRALFERESDGQHVLYGQFVIAFGCANIQQVVEEPGNQLASEAIVRLHLDIASAEGYPGDDDQLSIQAIEFWNTYIEYVNDTLFSKDTDDPDPTWLPQAKSILMQAFQLLWKKMLTPPGDIAQDWGDDEREGFKEFRIDAADLFLSIFVLLGRDMLEQLVNLTVQSLESKHWQAVEASLFCLNTLADNILEDTANEPYMQRVFQSTLFKEIADFATSLPTQTRRTAIDLLGSYGNYIERHAEFLPDAVRFLFASLETPGLANSAAKSIASLCSTCRSSLTNELPGFMQQYSRFLESDTRDSYTQEKVIGAIAAIIQAVSPEQAKAEPLLALLDYVEKDIARAQQLKAAGDTESAEACGITALECLASIGKGMQVPEDVPIDVYDDDEDVTARTGNHWESEQGCSIQQRIVGCFSALQIVGTRSEAIDAVCQVLRSGYTENVPGPFVLPPSVTVSFVQQCNIGTPLLETVLSTAAMMILQHSRHDAKRIDSEVDIVLTSIKSFVQTLGQSKEDPPLAAACIELCGRAMDRYASVLFAKMDSSILDFLLSAITSSDTLPKKAACEFSTKLFTMKAIRATTPSSTNDVQQKLEELVMVYGEKFVYCMVLEIGGLALRSQLDFLCEPLKALLLNHSQARGWLQTGINALSNSNVGTDQKAKFLQQLFRLLSDGKKFKEVVRGFWAACRGTVVSYG